MDDWTTNHSCNKICTLRSDLSSMEIVTYAAVKDYFRIGGGDFFFMIMRYGNGEQNWRDQEQRCPSSRYYRHLDNKQRKINLLVEFLPFSFAVLMRKQAGETDVWKVYLLTHNTQLIAGNFSWSPMMKIQDRAATRIHPITTTVIKSANMLFSPQLQRIHLARCLGRLLAVQLQSKDYS